MAELTIPSAADRLAADADLFRALVRGVGEEQARWKPAPDRWSVLEVVNHLADEEVEDFRRRLDFTLQRPGEAWPPIDPQGWVEERRYNERELGASLDRFLEERARSVAWLRGLGTPELGRRYEHGTLGTILAGELLASWVAHDLIHVRQITRLLYRWLEREVAPWRLDYAGPF